MYNPNENESIIIKFILWDIDRFEKKDPIKLSKYFEKRGRGTYVKGNELEHIKKVKKAIESKVKRGQKFILCKKTSRIR